MDSKGAQRGKRGRSAAQSATKADKKSPAKKAKTSTAKGAASKANTAKTKTAAKKPTASKTTSSKANVAKSTPAKGAASKVASSRATGPKSKAPKTAASKPSASAAKPMSKKVSGPLELVESVSYPNDTRLTPSDDQVGTDAPPFCVKDQDGSEVTLESFKGEKFVVVFFYPKDNTPGCTKEACKFRDLKDEYDALDCVVLGVSADHEVSHGKFIAKFGLNFTLLADTDRSLIKPYGASKAGDKIQRSTVLIDKEGKVAAVWNPVSGAEQHPVAVLARLKEILHE